MRKLCSSIIMFSVLLLTSCADKLFDEFTVEKFGFDDECVFVEFNLEADKNSIKKALTLKKDDALTEGRFDFTDKTVRFYPVDGIEADYEWKLTVDNNAESSGGVSLKKPFVKDFSTKNDCTAPIVKSITPSKAENVEQEIRQIEIQFSEKIDRQSFFDSFTITPSFSYIVDFSNDDKTVTISPEQSFPVNTEYQITVGDGLKDLHNNYLEQDFMTYFYYLLDDRPPLFSVELQKADSSLVPVSDGALFTGLCGQEKLIITFDEKIDGSSAASFIEFGEGLSGQVEFDSISRKQITVSLSSVEYLKTYAIKIKKGITDLCGNECGDSLSCILTFDSPKIMNVSFVRGLIQKSEWKGDAQHSQSDTIIFDSGQNFLSLLLDGSYYEMNEAKPFVFFLIFNSSPVAKGVELVSVMQNVSVSATNGTCSVELKKIELIGADKYESEKISTLVSAIDSTEYSNLSVFKVSCLLTNSQKSGLFTVSLSKEICDSIGNKMKADQVFVFNK